MTELTRFIRSEIEPFDVLFKNFFDNRDFFSPAVQTNFNYPVDIFESENAIHINIAIPGIDKEDINIEEHGGILNVSYDKKESCNSIEKENEEKRWIKRGITRKSFKMGWKISDKFNLKKIEAEMDNGLLQISIPRSEEKTITKQSIQIK